MPLYGVICHHDEANMCAVGSKRIRDHVKKHFSNHEELAKQLGVKILAMPSLTPAHKGFLLFEATNAEAVRDFLVKGGLYQFMDLDFYLAVPMREMLDWANAVDPLF